MLYCAAMSDGSIRIRLDQWLVAHKLAPTRSRARDLILRGTVTVSGNVCRKPGQLVCDGIAIADAGAVGAKYVSRGALKLIAALDHFNIDVRDKACLDVGASTGGFTQVLLERGAAAVTAVDVGTSQFAHVLRADARVRVLESQDARGLDQHMIPQAPGIVTADVSFISLTLALPAAMALAIPSAHLVALVKPQFEAGRAAIGKGGIVRSAGDRNAAVERVQTWIATQAGWRVLGVIPSPIEGKSGNAEFLLAARKDKASPA
jgi:23S rRNA (cytidine1920-2'-O)/16S rRNA (cytidine1409-2'-O)-methyltransferase